MDGSEKLKLLVIGPAFSKGSKRISYESNTNAWMTQFIFETWLRERGAEFTRKGRKALFIVDNCPAHGEIQELKSIHLEFLPANTAAILQPMDQGIIQNLKVFFRRHVVGRMMLCMDRDKECQLDLLSAIHVLAHLWDEVTPTIQRCFHRAGFPTEVSMDHQVELDDVAEAQAAFRLGTQIRH